MRVLPGKAALQKAFGRVSVIVLFSSACNCGTAQSVTDGEAIRPIDAERGGDVLYHLDVKHPTVQQAIETHGTSLQGYKFVQIEVAEVTNPKRHPLTFEVRFQSKENVTAFLGSFSLYPSDNPGTFIVPTLGKLKDEGAIILSMVTPDMVGEQDTVSVAIRKMKLVNG